MGALVVHSQFCWTGQTRHICRAILGWLGCRAWGTVWLKLFSFLVTFLIQISEWSPNYINIRARGLLWVSFSNEYCFMSSDPWVRCPVEHMQKTGKWWFPITDGIKVSKERATRLPQNKRTGEANTNSYLSRFLKFRSPLHGLRYPKAISNLWFIGEQRALEIVVKAVVLLARSSPKPKGLLLLQRPVLGSRHSRFLACVQF